MSRFGKIVLAAAVTLPLGLVGCRPNRGTANPEDYFPLIQVALAGGETAALIGRNEAIKARNFGGCVAAESLASTFDGATQVLGGRLQSQIVFPALEVDVADCLALRGGGESAVVVSPAIVAAYVAPAEESESGDAQPAEEPASAEPEPEAEEPEPAEPEAEEPAADPLLAGNEDAAVLVETIAGVTLTAILHYATRLKTANCKKGTAALGAVHYVGGMIKPIADEIANPDGKVSVPAVTVDLSECASEG